MEEIAEAKKRKLVETQSFGFGFWKWAAAAVLFRLILIYFPISLNLASRPEVSTPVTSLRRLAEGYWLKKLSMSPYAGSMYHGSPLLLSILGPLTVKSFEGQSNHLLCRYPSRLPVPEKVLGVDFYCICSFAWIRWMMSNFQLISGCSLLSVVADSISAVLIRGIGQRLQIAYDQNLRWLGLAELVQGSLPSGDIAALVYLWNPFTILTCVGFNSTPIENMIVILSLYGACTGLVPLAAFGWVLASHLSLYPVFLVVPIVILLGCGVDGPPRKLFSQFSSKAGKDIGSDSHIGSIKTQATFCLLRPILLFTLWAAIWASYLLILCGISLKKTGGLLEMFERTYGFILTVKDLSPNIGVQWYLFAEVFEFFRDFFLLVCHANILFMILPLAIRLYNRPCFLAFVYMAISSILKSYPSVGDSALYLSLLALFTNELAEIQFSFFLFCGYVGVSLLSPVMHNLWIWRGTGNANFYFATAMAYACFQIVLVVESVSSMLNHDRRIRKLSSTEKAKVS
ncbi:OLC1v1029571C2 [Oldenlandia corymbosa var. corymbosa]|uniref:OLC1v1029571C2 n=1 Tax=Oldenlandia corymbosa var. corymbosa TaxID=529605 RepID=A0AAV1CE42_OLDCO|nr:OLC1v1029571C2 [Oldenlandia corymbosa var. corymbosa]